MSQTKIKQFNKIRKRKSFKINSDSKEQDMNLANAVITLGIETSITSKIDIKKCGSCSLSFKSKGNNLEKNSIINISSDDEIKNIPEKKSSHLKRRAKRKPSEKPPVTIKKPLKVICLDSDDDFQLTETKSLNENKLNLSLDSFIVQKSQKFLYNNSDSDFESELNKLPKTSVKKKGVKRYLNMKKLEKETPKASIQREEFSKSKRKLTNSTNLKQFSAKNQPNSQKFLKHYFQLMPKSTIGYYDTFKESFQTNQAKDNTRNIKVEKYLENNALQLDDNKLLKMNEFLPEDNSVNVARSSLDSTLVCTSKRVARKKLQFLNEEIEKSNKITSIKVEDVNGHNDSISDCILIESEPDDLKDTKLDVISDKFSKNFKTISKKQNTRILNTTLKKQRKRIECPKYKIVENTTFAVDAFRFGEIEGITHYFLTHFHGDHYIGLTKKFAKPIYMSEITARLVDSFIRVDKQYIHIIKLNQSLYIECNDMKIEVTAIDANHCPGAVMFAFKFPNSKCYLHTGDFRASIFMESEPFFWNNTIDLIYLDTTYLNKNYAFKDQSDSLNDLEEVIKNFQINHIGKKILYICGSYVIGKEKVWYKLHELAGGLIYVDKNRKKALQAIGDTNILQYLVDDPHMANIHVLSMNEVSYLKMWDYLKDFEDDCDLILGIRASGWERNAKPQYRGKINIVGIEYSEHSSYTELRRFVRFLQPKEIISTVPNGSDLSKTAQIPISWYNNSLEPKQQGFQKSITNYIYTKKSIENSNNQSPNMIFDATLSTGANSETDWMS